MSHTHTQSKGVYLSVLLILLFLTVVTVAAAQVDFGSWNIVVALLIASVKAILVLLFFMHLKFEDAIVWVYAAIPVVLIAIMVGGVYLDTPFRDENLKPQTHVEQAAGHAMGEGHGEVEHGEVGHGEQASAGAHH